MDSPFNMDFILGNPIPRRIGSYGVSDGGQQNWIYGNLPSEEKEERMLPDSSLSPSNQNFHNYMMDESKLSDTEFNKPSTEKINLNTDVSIYNKHCRLVIDSKGDEYLVAETHLVPIVDACKDLFDKQIPSPSKDCTITTTSNTIIDPPIISSKPHTVPFDVEDGGGGSGGPIMECFLYASQLALVEVKLKDLEKELSNLDSYSFSQYINSATNLRSIPGQTFLFQERDSVPGGSGDANMEFGDADDVRRIRLGQILSKHSELKRWLAKIKKKLKEKNVSKLRHIVDFSSREETELPLPEYIEDRNATFIDRDPASSSVSSYDEAEDSLYVTNHRSHLNRLSQMINENSAQDIQDENGNIITNELKNPSQAQSKDGSDPEEIPNLSYEYESCRDSDLNYKGAKSISDDQVVSTDSDGPQHQNPPTPDLRRAELDSNDISEGIRVLVVQTDYLRAGTIHLTNNASNDDGVDQKLWRVTIDGDRKCQDIVLSEWQLLEQGVREVIPTSISQLSPGSRVCANWSVQLPMNLYPGTITLSSSDHFPSLTKLPIDFDDGDHKDVDIDQVRLLPENFPNLHELMKAAHIVDSNVYSLDRKNRIKKKKVTRVVSPNNPKTCFKSKRGRPTNNQIKKKIPLEKVQRKKKIVVQWKLTKKNIDSGTTEYELVRNLDNLCIKSGDNVQLLSYSRHIYMANIVSVLARHQGPIMEIEFNWYYILADIQDNSEIIKRLKKSTLSKKIVFQTSHLDINDAYSVLRRVDVLSFSDYRTRYLSVSSKKDVPSDSYIMAGKYDQRKSKVDSVDEDIRRFIMTGNDDGGDC